MYLLLLHYTVCGLLTLSVFEGAKQGKNIHGRDERVKSVFSGTRLPIPLFTGFCVLEVYVPFQNKGKHNGAELAATNSPVLGCLAPRGRAIPKWLLLHPVGATSTSSSFVPFPWEKPQPLQWGYSSLPQPFCQQRLKQPCVRHSSPTKGARMW